MPDYTGSRAREDALTVGCRWCHAIAGDPCINTALDSKPVLWHFAAHTVRITDANRKD